MHKILNIALLTAYVNVLSSSSSSSSLTFFTSRMITIYLTTSCSRMKNLHLNVFLVQLVRKLQLCRNSPAVFLLAHPVYCVQYMHVTVHEKHFCSVQLQTGKEIKLRSILHILLVTFG